MNPEQHASTRSPAPPVSSVSDLPDSSSLVLAKGKPSSYNHTLLYTVADGVRASRIHVQSRRDPPVLTLLFAHQEKMTPDGPVHVGSRSRPLGRRADRPTAVRKGGRVLPQIAVLKSTKSPIFRRGLRLQPKHDSIIAARSRVPHSQNRLPSSNAALTRRSNGRKGRCDYSRPLQMCHPDRTRRQNDDYSCSM